MTKTFKSYDAIPSEVFSDKILELALKDPVISLTLPGIYEIISEEYNNAALDELCPKGNIE